MTYQVLARKWRPQTFSSLIGQEPIVAALRNALKEGKLAQAYLFSGIRGVGKTTAARVLAKALNCERGPAPDPCNECTACVEITRGSDLDVQEVDAATYSKVEQVRELTESLKYGPARDRYKVVVIDEIHRLSRQAFDALLKIVEEPPPHLVFIFATTEIDAVPATILSRCQEFHFRRVPSQLVAAHLRQICTAEGIAASDAALRLLARAGEGSLRDAVALLDQLATFGSGAIADDEAVRLLGGLDTALFAELLRAIVAGDAPSVSAVARRVEDEGWDPRHIYAQFLAFCRDALHLGLGGQPEHVDLPVEEAVSLAELARGAGYENLLRLLSQLLASEPLIRRSDTGTLAVEIAWLRAAELPKLVRVEALLAGGAPVPAISPPAAERSLPPARPSTATASPSPATAPTAPAIPAATSETALAAFREEVSRRKAPLAGLLETASLAFSDGRLAISVPRGDFSATKLRAGANPQILSAAVAAVWGPEATWSALEAAAAGGTDAAAGPSAPAAALATPAAPADIAVADNPTVQAVLDIFKGRVETIEEHGNATED